MQNTPKTSAKKKTSCHQNSRKVSGKSLNILKPISAKHHPPNVTGCITISQILSMILESRSALGGANEIVLLRFFG